MKARKIKDRIYWMGSVDWDRRLFDALVPLPDGTSYNAYLIEGSEKTVLLDSVDPARADELMAQLGGGLYNRLHHLTPYRARPLRNNSADS